MFITSHSLSLMFNGTIGWSDYNNLKTHTMENPINIKTIKIGTIFGLTHGNTIKVTALKDNRFDGEFIDKSGRVRSTSASVMHSTINNPHYKGSISVIEL